MMEMFSIASGSSGNCICAGNDDTHVMIDAGISGKKIEAGMNTYDLTTKDMAGILVTHDHIDVYYRFKEGDDAEEIDDSETLEKN